MKLIIIEIEFYKITKNQCLAFLFNVQKKCILNLQCSISGWLANLKYNIKNNALFTRIATLNNAIGTCKILNISSTANFK